MASPYSRPGDRIGNAIIWLYFTYRRHRTYFRALPFTDAVVFMVNDLIKRRSLKLTIVNQIPLRLRTATSDCDVAAGSLVDDEYARIDCSNPSVIVDAGANIGTSAIAFARRYPQAKIFAIELEAENFHLLTLNTQPYANIVPIRAALAATAGDKTVLDRMTGPWGYTIAPTSAPTGATGQQVPGLTLDGLMQAHALEKIDLLKIDIEGGEKEIFETGGAWLDHTDVIAAELHDRICPGCDRAFYLATSAYRHFEKHRDKVIAYRT